MASRLLILWDGRSSAAASVRVLFELGWVSWLCKCGGFSERKLEEGVCMILDCCAAKGACIFSAGKLEEGVRMVLDRCAADEAAGCLGRVRLSKSAALARASLNGASRVAGWRQQYDLARVAH